MVQRIDLLSVLPTWRGGPYPVRWLSNEAVLIGGLCNCDGPLEGEFEASVSLDGSVTPLLEGAPPEHGVDVEITDRFDPSCNLGGFNGGRSARLVDTATGEVVAEADEQAPVLVWSRLSPDETEALIMMLEVGTEARAFLNEALDTGKCVDWETARGRSTTPPQFAVLRAGATTLDSLATRLEVLERKMEVRR